MIWNLLLIPALCALVGGCIKYVTARAAFDRKVAAYDRRDKFSYINEPRWYAESKGMGGIVAGACLACAWLLASVVGTGLQYNEQGKLKHTVELVDAKRDQRDALLVQVRDELSTEAYAALMAATPESDLLVIIGNQASDVLIERARLVVALNQDLYALENEQIHRRIDLCTYAENPFTPRLFVLPGCPERE